MNWVEADNMARAALAAEGLDRLGWTVVWDRAVVRYGYCDYDRKVISLSRPLVKLSGEAEVRDTIMHEVAHAMTEGAYHGEAWKALSERLGFDPESQAEGGTRMPHRWLGRCPGGHTWDRHRRALGALCGTCGGPVEWVERSLVAKDVGASMLYDRLSI